jgi:hypothetical protein
LEKWLLLVLGQEIFNISLEHPVVPEDKEVLPLQKKKKKLTRHKN